MFYLSARNAEAKGKTMDIPRELTPKQEAAAKAAAKFTSSTLYKTRLTCLDCFGMAEGDALENGAPDDDEATAWAALYLASGDSNGCWNHEEI